MKHIKFLWKSLLVLTLFAGFNLSCSKEDDEQPDVTDPIVGTWNLRAIHDGQQGRDVTNEACFKDSRFVIDPKVMHLTLSAPNAEDGDCQIETISFEWINDNGTYYLVDGNERQQAGISLNDDNQTLQMMITADGQQVALLFRK